VGETRVTGTFASRAYRFYTQLRGPRSLRVPKGVEVMNPYEDARVRRSLRAFLGKFFDDNRERTFVFGINPGRFGAGITGVTFTDPVALADFCGIPNHLPRRRELSSLFIYDMIAAYGGPERFYGKFFLSAASPLGFTNGGLNLNYYDTPELRRATRPFIVESIRKHIKLGCRTDRAIVLGIGANYKFLEALNEEHRFFGKLDAVEHPRPIMQYRRKRVAEYIEKYLEVLG
jgi:hypothetical protein